MKKLILFVVAMLLLASPAFGGLVDRSFIKLHGGVVATTEQIEQGAVEGFFTAGIVFPLYTPKGWNIYGEGSFSDINNAEEEWENYAGKIIFFTKEPAKKELNFYGFAGGSITHDPTWDENLGKGGFDGGFGLIIPTAGAKFLGEVAAKRLEGKTTCMFTLGMMFGLDPDQ